MFFDVETDGLFDGDEAPNVNCVVIVDGADNKAYHYFNYKGGPMTPDLVDKAAEKLLNSKEIVYGFNSCSFDFRCLANRASPSTAMALAKLCLSDRHVDVMLDFASRTGYFSSLASMAEAINGGTKLMQSGADAITAWNEGRFDEVLAYCEQDVRMLQNIAENAVRYGRHERVTNKDKKLQTVMIENYELRCTMAAFEHADTVDQSWMTDPPDIAAAGDWALAMLGAL